MERDISLATLYLETQMRYAAPMEPTPNAAAHATRLGRADAAPVMAMTSLIWQVGSLLTDLLTAELDGRVGLPLGEAEVLMATRVRGDLPTTPADLRAQLNLTSAGITKRIDQVEAKGLLERRPHPTDRRSVTLHLTPAGVEQADETISTVAAVMVELTGDQLGAGEIAAITDGLSKLVPRLRDIGS